MTLARDRRNSLLDTSPCCLTHNDIDDALIVETELYMKECLSAVRDFDIRVRYDNAMQPKDLISITLWNR